MSLCDVILQYGVAEGDISEGVWTNYLRAMGGAKDGSNLVLKSQMIREGEPMGTGRSSRLGSSRSNSSGNIRDSSGLFSRQATESSRGTLKGEQDGGDCAQSISGRETDAEARTLSGAEAVEENEELADGLREGEDDSDADGEEDDDAKGISADKREEAADTSEDLRDPQIPPPDQSEDRDEDGDELDEDARSLSPPADSGLQEGLLSRKSSLSSQSGHLTAVPSARRMIQTAGADTYRSSSCSTGRSETAPSSSIAQYPLSYPGYTQLAHHHTISSPADYTTGSPSPSGSVKRIARDDGFTFSESVLANRMIAGLNTVVTSSQGQTQQASLSSSPIVVAAAVGKSTGGSVPLISALNEANR
jgi:hypothetical protein